MILLVNIYESVKWKKWSARYPDAKNTQIDSYSCLQSIRELRSLIVSLTLYGLLILYLLNWALETSHWWHTALRQGQKNIQWHYCTFTCSERLLFIAIALDCSTNRFRFVIILISCRNTERSLSTSRATTATRDNSSRGCDISEVSIFSDRQCLLRTF